ncbi:MAG: hypothetical protein IJH91_01005 [Mogibacterium sp.]|nr:hypothetical protein [Mogibacterium sp.]
MKDTDRSKTTTRELAELSILCAMMFAGKEALRMIPNVHPVTVIILLAVILYGWKALYPVFGFVFLEFFVYGFGVWSIMYLYIWPLLVVIAMPLRESRNWLLWAVLACFYGLGFGALCSIPYIFISGFKAAVAFWIAGIPFDIVHGISNFLLTLVLLPLLYKIVFKLKNR